MYNPTSTINNASVLCEICYDQGLFPLSFHSSDFIQLKTEEGEKWSEQEILLLLEGIEMFGTYEPPSSTGPVNVNANLNNQWIKSVNMLLRKPENSVSSSLSNTN